MADVSIEIRNLKKSYSISQKKGFSFLDLPYILKKKQPGKDPIKKILDDINLDIYRGECFGIIGSNGTGKSTLLRLIAGIIPPDSGSVKVNGSLIPLLSLGVGFSDELNAHDNIYQYGMILGFSEKDMDSLYDDIITFSGLDQYQYMPLKNFSSGMRVKLGFATAIQIQPDILILDEVLSVGDISFKEKSRQKILDFCRSDKTVVIVSHSMGTISDLCNRAMFLKDGKIGQIGDPQKVIDAYMGTMQEIIGPKDIVFAQGMARGRESRIQDQSYVRQLNSWVAGLHIHPLIRDNYDSGIERSLSEYLTWKNVKKISQLEEVFIGTGDIPPQDEFFVGYCAVSFLNNLGDEKRSRIVATRLMKNLFSEGFVFFGEDNTNSFFSENPSRSDRPQKISIILISDGLKTIPLLIDRKEKVSLDHSSVRHILEKIHWDENENAHLVIPPEFYCEQTIVNLLENKIRFLATVPEQEIEENCVLQEFLDEVVSPDSMNIILDKPVFTRKSRFEIQNHEIDGCGYFIPRGVLQGYTGFFKKIVELNTMLEGVDPAISVKPEEIISDIAKKYSKYFKSFNNDDSLEITYEFGQIQKRQKIIGAVFQYHSGNLNSFECYRNYERWRLINDAVNLYLKINTAGDPLFRGKALLALIDKVIWLGLV